MKNALLCLVFLFTASCCDKEKEAARASLAAKDKELEEYKSALRYQAYRMLRQVYDSRECEMGSHAYVPQARRDDLVFTCRYTFERALVQTETLRQVDPGFLPYICQNFGANWNNVILNIYYQSERFEKIDKCYRDQHWGYENDPTNVKKQKKILECVYEVFYADENIREAAKEQVRALCAQTTTHGGVK